jgi:peptidoglycan/xylan/chitin deacetylase (PgdA/CDA1 family)
MLRVLTFHRVAPLGEQSGLDPLLLSATPDEFRRQMRHLRRRYNLVSLADAIAAFTGRRPLPPRAVLVTFDDAYSDFLEYAWPILRELHVPVTLFVPTAFPGHPWRSLWWDRMYRAVAANGAGGWDRAVVRAAAADGDEVQEMTAREARAMLRGLTFHEAERTLDRICAAHAHQDDLDQPAPALLSWDQIRSLAQEGVAFGAHTCFHVALTRVDLERARLEIRESLADLRREVGDIPAVLAYPYGMHNDHTVRVAQEEGCVLAFTCDDGLNTPGRTNPLRLRRTNITLRTTALLFSLRMLPWFAHVDRLRHRGERARLRT